MMNRGIEPSCTPQALKLSIGSLELDVNRDPCIDSFNVCCQSSELGDTARMEALRNRHACRYRMGHETAEQLVGNFQDAFHVAQP